MSRTSRAQAHMVTVDSRHRLTLPGPISQAAHIEAGDPLEVVLVPEGILLRPKKIIDAAQAWFWTSGWQERERAASEDVAAGRVIRSESDEDFLESLR